MPKDKVIQDIYPLSPMQSGLLFHALYAPQSDVYFVQSIYELNGNIDAVALKSAWQAVTTRYPILRTGFFWKDGEDPFQFVVEYSYINFTEHDWQYLGKEERMEKLEIYIQEDRQKRFDLSNPPLFRIALIQYTLNQYYLIWSQHHILLDGWCLPIILADLIQAYKDIKQEKNIHFQSRPPYRNYIAWLQEQDLNQAEIFWKEYLRHLEGPTRLSFENIIEPQGEECNSYFINFSSEETDYIKKFAQNHNLTLNTVIQGAVGILLRTYTQQQEVVMGVTVSGRSIDLPGVEDMVGLFINTLPLRMSFREDEDILSFLKNLQEQMQKLNEYAYVSLSQIQSWSGISQSLFDVIFVFENYPFSEDDHTDLDFSIECIKNIEKTEYPLNITVLPGEKLCFNISYQTNHFSVLLIQRLGEHLQQILKKITCSSQCLSNTYVQDLSLLTSQEHDQILIEWNDTQVIYPEDKCIHELFEYQVEKTPNSIAVVYENHMLTYQQLNEKANQLAHYLRSLGVCPDTLIGIAMERSVEMIIALLGILKSGAAYLPLDPAYPTERLKFIINDSKVSILITHMKFEKIFSTTANLIINIDTNSETIFSFSKDNLVSLTTPENLICVIYTSASSGNPKGVLIDHKSILNRFTWMWEKYPFDANEVCCQKTSLNFGDSIWEVFGVLLKGVKLILIEPKLMYDLQEFINIIYKESITRLVLVPSLLNTILQYNPKLLKEFFKSLKICVVSGEALPPSTSHKFRSIFQNRTKLLNLYGSTEVAADVTFYEENFKTINGKWEDKVVIGRPISNIQIYLLDKGMNVVPFGILGEIYIGGIGLTRGYLNQPGLTAERFVPNPFFKQENPQSSESLRLYRTGDLAQYLPDGNIEFLGRIDNQIKIRGFRIELKEIETTLTMHNDISHSIVIAHGNSTIDKKLVAYIVPKKEIIASLRIESTLISSAEEQFSILQGENLSVLTENLRAHLSCSLPDYMIPSFFIFIDKIPLNPNAKIDYKILSESNSLLTSAPNTYIAAKTTLEHKVHSIWSELLKIKHIGIHDNFFKIGGHSLLVPQVILQLHQKISKNISVMDIFKNPTIFSIAKVLETEFKSIRTTTLLPIQICKNQTPLFLAHPAGGLAYCYIELADYIKNMSIYGINNPNFENFQQNLNTVEEMAAYYIKLIKEIQKRGPYFIGGWSFGGLIAYEIAQQLTSKNEIVEHLILIDTNKPRAFKRKLSNKYYRLKNPISNEILNEKGENKLSVDRLLNILEYNFIDSKLKTLFYKPKKYSGKVTLLKAELNNQISNNISDYGWGKLIKDLHIIDMPIYHEEFFDKQHILQTSENIKRTINRT